MEPDFKQTIFIDLIHYPVYTLGIGKRTGLWFQGCSIGCKGCISEHSWKATDSNKTTVSNVLESISSNPAQIKNGITISGGEPFDQPEALFSLLFYLRKSGNRDIMVYSGYKYAFLEKKYSQIFSLIDILVDGRFEEGQLTDMIWKGSENQNMIILTENEGLKEKYLDYKNKIQEKRSLQILQTDDNLLHIIGIPRQRDAMVIKDGFF